jgi:hypothetical protein
LTQKHDSELAETERKVGKARADAEQSQKALDEAQAKHSEALDDAAVAQEEAVAQALAKASQEHGEKSEKAVAEAVSAANDDAATARAALTQSLQAAQTKALEEQADSLQEAHEASTRKLEAVHEEALAAQKRNEEALASKVDRADAARKSLEAKCNDLEARLKQAADAHARELRATREDLELRHRADKEAAVLQAKWGASSAPAPKAAPVQRDDGRRIKELEAAHAIELRRARSEAEHLRQQVDALQQSNAYYEQRGSGGCAVDVVPRASFAARGCMASVSNNIDRLMNMELPFNSR